MALAIGSLSEGVPLYRRDLLVMSPVTSRQNLALMPPGKKGQVTLTLATAPPSPLFGGSDAAAALRPPCTGARAGGG